MKTVILVSGGVDSYIAYHYMLDEGFSPVPVYVELGHKYQEEELRALATLERKGLLEPVLRRPGFSGLGAVEHDDGFIAGRNAFLVLATLEMEPDQVILTVQKDETALVDRCPEFFTLMSALMSQQLRKLVEVKTPFWLWDKTSMVHWMKERTSQAVFSGMLDTVACYRPVQGSPCFTCPACFRRAVAFVNNGVFEHGSEKLWRSPVVDEYLAAILQKKYPDDRAHRTLEALGAVKRKSWLSASALDMFERAQTLYPPF